MTTVLDALRNAQINFENLRRIIPGIEQAFVYKVGTTQLSNAIEALENGKSPGDTLQENLFEPVKTR